MSNDKNQKLKIIFIVLVLISLIILVNILKNIRNKDGIWNYSEITSASEVISEGTNIVDREIYYVLEDIVVRFLLSNSEGTVDDLASYGINYEATYEDYYSILISDYKRFLSKKEFKEVASKFTNKFISISAEGYKYIQIENILQGIYMYGKDKYLCVLSSNNNLAYFGVKLNESNNSYSIFYVE